MIAKVPCHDSRCSDFAKTTGGFHYHDLEVVIGTSTPLVVGPISSVTVTVTCPKCGGSDLHTRFFAETDPDRLHVGFLGLSDSSGLHGCYRRDEHLHRTCQTCGYWWAEDCADAKPPTVSPPVITPVITPRIGNDLANKTTDSPFAPTSSAECHAEL